MKAEAYMNPGTEKEQPPLGAPIADHARPFHTIHDDVETWTDTCSCEPEPRWQAVTEELKRQAQSEKIEPADSGSG